MAQNGQKKRNNAAPDINSRGIIPGRIHDADMYKSNKTAVKAAKPQAGATGERGIIAIMQQILNCGSHTPDDLGYGTLGRRENGARIALNTDTLVQSTDIPPGMTLRQAARKSAIACMSDFAAKGIRPEIGTVSVNIPKDASISEITDIARGFADVAHPHKISIVAGDTNRGAEFVFCICMVGRQPALQSPGRGGARAGDAIFVTGPFGYTSLGLEILIAGRDADGTVARAATKSVTMPNTRVEFGERAYRYFTSSMDSSDGLAATLNEMARQSGCEFEIHTMPATNQFIKYARQNSINLEKMIFYGGEEYEIVFTAAPSDKNKLAAIAARLRVPLMEIGTVAGHAGKKKKYTENSAASASPTAIARVYLIHNKTGRRKTIADGGWDHFL